MNEEDIKEFMNAFEDFMKHAEVEELYHEGRKTAKQYADSFRENLEQKAAELEVTVDYYLAEFV